MGYAPSLNKFSLKQEGLGRYSTLLINALLDNDHSVVIACPKYCVEAVEELLEDLNSKKEKVVIVSSKKNPVALRLINIWKKRKKKGEKHSKITKKLIRVISKLLTYILTEKSIIRLSIVGFILSMAGLLLGIAGVIGGVVFGIIFSFLFLILFAFKRIIRKIHGLKGSSLGNKLVCFYKKIKKAYVHEGLKIRERMRMDAMEGTLKRIEQMKDKPDIWYSPTAFWPEFNRISGKKVICAPDLVTVEFAEGFSKGRLSFSTAQTRTALEEGMYFVTYSKYIAEQLLMNKLGKNINQIQVIPHAMNDMLQYLDIKNTFKLGVYNYDINEHFAKNVVFPGMVGKNIGMQQYLGTFSFGDMRYIFYPSQIRENKNIWMLIKVYERLLRERKVSVKLILTCDINQEPELKKYIYAKRLQYDVLFFKSVSSQQLAALYMCAQLVVTPTLYEGGFPFTFGEGMSVGTPSIMSNIPQVIEVLEQYNFLSQAEKWIFDVYDEGDLERKLYYALEHIDELSKEQEELYDILNQRTWKDVGLEYLSYFENVILSKMDTR